jgi:hypothetical protein
MLTHNRISKTEPGGADRAMSEIQKNEPMDADRAMSEVTKCEPTAAGQCGQNDAERVALNKQAQRQKEQSPAPRINVVDDYRGMRTELDHPDVGVGDALLKEALGTADDDFYLGFLAQLPAFEGDGQSGSVEKELNFRLSVVKSQKPKDELHAMLLALMGETFQMSMRAARNNQRIERVLSSIGKDVKDPFVIREINSITKNLSLLQERTDHGFNRSVRTYAMLSEASDRHRRSGEPSTTVQQLTVAEGGQAIVGSNITHATPQAALNNQAAGPRALTDQQHLAMPIIVEPERVPVPIRRRKRQ